MLEAIGIALVIACLRTVDVSLATMKTVFIVEGRGLLAPALGFVEATVYVIAATLVFRDLGNPIMIIGFGAGFASGTALGIYMARRLALGNVTLRFFASGDSAGLVQALRESGYRLTEMSGMGRDGPVAMIQINMRKRLVPTVLELTRPWLDHCFVTVGDEPLVYNPDQPTASAIKEALRNMTQAPWAAIGRRPHA